MVEKANTLHALQLAGTMVLCLFSLFTARAQSTYQAEKQIEPFKPDSSYYLGDWVLAPTIQIRVNGEALSPQQWKFENQTGLLSFLGDFPENPEVIVYYQALPLTLSRTHQPLKPIEADPGIFKEPDSLAGQLAIQQNQQTLSEANLRQSGSLSRGVIVGTNQDFALESGLNFELSGAITENVNINASLTDQSIPIQPDGTTQNLREFDKVFIQLETSNASVEMGDVDVSLEQSTFARFNRRLQGASGALRSNVGDYRGAVSVVRGTYKSISFNGEEGVQGPYRLTGKNNEEFVMILAGTERVYVNGQRVQRGADNDYVIDYGLGEVIFTSDLLVKDETRIIIEYEYIDQDFNRTLVAAEAGDEFFNGKLKIGTTVIRQADGNDLLSQQSLNEDDIDLLREAGDNLDNAVVSGARRATEEERNRYLMYAETDTVVNGEVFTIYEHRPGSEESIYRVQFSNVGEDEGSYERIGGDANGLLYEWVGPGEGDYEPFRQLPAPEKHQMVAINGSYQVGRKFELFGEWAASDFDANRFSPMDDGDNTDMAYESGFRVNEINSALGKINARLSRRYSGNRFRYFERTRDVEFERKWNISRIDESREAINEAAVSVSPTLQTTVEGEIGYIKRQDFTGLRQASTVSSNEHGILNVNYTQDWIQSEDELLLRDGDWFRQKGTIGKEVQAGSVEIAPYISFEQETRIQRHTQTDSLYQASDAFYDLGPGLRLKYSDVELDASIAYRREKGVLDNRMADEATAFEQRYRVNYHPGQNFETTNEIRLRDKTYTEAFEEQGRATRQGLLIKSVTSYTAKNEVVDGEFYYQANTQRRALMQEAYIEVGPELGQYVWDDLNGDGVQQVDEFFPEVSSNEGVFVRQFLPSDDLFPVIDLNVRLLHTFRPFGGNDDDDENWWAGLSLRSRVDITENSTTQNLKDVYLLKLKSFRNDSTTVEGRMLWEKEIDVLPGVSKGDLRVGYSQNRSLNKRSTESIWNYTDRLYLNTAYDITGRVRLTMDAQNSTNRSESSRLQNRNFDIVSTNLKPGISATLNRSWNAGLEFSFIRKEDRFPAEQVEADLIKIATTHRTYLWRKLQANFRLELRNTTVTGSSSSYGSYELTEGTGEGTNLIWTLNSTYQTNNLIRFSFNYDGRTVRDRPAIHTIKLVMSATF